MDLADVSFFTADPSDPTGVAVLPTELAKSGWGDNHLHGVAVSGALARGIERAQREAGRDDLRPARYTVDLFRAATMDACVVATEIVRESGRLLLVDAVLTQHGERVARAGALFLKPTADPDGEVWTPGAAPSPPPLDVAPPTDEPRVPFLCSDAGWSQKFSEHQDASRKASWNSAVRVVRGETLTPWQSVASIADGASLVVNWGTNGVEHINTDISLSLARLPHGVEVGMEALDRVERDGIAVGTARVFDRDGAIGTVMVTSLVNARKAVDLGATDYNDDGTRINPQA